MKRGLILMVVLALLLPGGAGFAENRSAALRERVDAMWDTWAGVWSRTFLDGEVFLPWRWQQIPFVIWADEAPTLRVKEEENRVEITVSEKLGADWRICLGEGMPVVYRDCVYDGIRDCWTGEGTFDAVYLISDMASERIGISVTYQRTDDFRPSEPVVEWCREQEDNALTFSCIGWGTTRRFQGGMYAIGTDEGVFYAEYDSEGALIAWYDGRTGCQYDAEDRLVDGTEPEGYESHVTH